MTATEIIALVADKIQDPGYTDGDILDLINEGRGEIADDLDLPLLRTSDTVTTAVGSPTVALPSDYHKGLFWVGSANQGARIGKGYSEYHNLLRLLELYPTLDNVGEVVTACVDGTNLLYQGMVADTLTLRYYKNITEIPTPSDPVEPADLTTPEELPVNHQKNLLVSYCCKEIFADIEDGIEGRKVNTEFWETKHNVAKAKLSRYIKANVPREPKYMQDMS